MTNKGRVTKDGIRIYELGDFAGMNRAGRLAAQILDDVADLVAPGVSTAALDKFITEQVELAGATSATIGYKGYAHASCISVNHVVCHGIPGEKTLKDGDILNIDVTVIVDGWFGDTVMPFRYTLKATACRLCVISVATVSAACSTRRQMFCTMAVRARALCWKRACFLPLNQ